MELWGVEGMFSVCFLCAVTAEFSKIVVPWTLVYELKSVKHININIQFWDNQSNCILTEYNLEF